MDYKTIFNNVKYLALKHETGNSEKKDPMVILTKSGIGVLREKWGETVNKYGDKSTNAEYPKAPISRERHADAQRYDNLLLDQLLPFYTPPERYSFI